METLTLVTSIIAAVCGLGALICSILALTKSGKIDERAVASHVVEELKRQNAANSDAVVAAIGVQTQSLSSRLADAEQNAERHRAETAKSVEAMGKALQEGARAERQELGQAMETMRQAMEQNAQKTLSMTGERLETVRTEVAGQLKEIREENRRQLEQMRGVVDKQLQENLEGRLSKSFGLIGEQLQQVYKGLGEMQSLSGGMQDLKRVLTGVKTRGLWGELALGVLLEEILTPDQFRRDYSPRNKGEKVEYAVKLPGQGGDSVYLPIDSKFPLEYYEKVMDAAENGDKDALAHCQSELAMRIKKEGKSIYAKYVVPPVTTDFAVMYLPIEGLFAEVVRQAGLVEFLRRECKVVVAGPTTLTALLNSLQVGFRTVAIEKRSKELWETLETFRATFDKFSVDLMKAEKQLNFAANALKATEERTAAISATLKNVSALDTGEEMAIAADVAGEEDE